MRTSPRARRAFTACCALSIGAIATPVAGSATTQTEDLSRPTATTAAPSTQRERLNVRVGQAAVVAGTAASGRTVVLERRSRGRWQSLDHARTDATGRYRLRHVARAAGTSRVRVRITGTRSSRRVGRMNVYRRSFASWYGPGFYGRRTACGQTVTDSVMGVAHRTLPCGTRLTLRRGGRIVRARVIDRGPFHAGREFDLTPAVKRALGFGSTGTVEVAL
jgi:rare lipoprotein A (peptidoglycan hydrolase)